MQPKIREIPCPAGVPRCITMVKISKKSNGFIIEDVMQYPVLPPDDPNHDMLKRFYHQQYLDTHISTFYLPLYSHINKRF
jgi:hypothetical protein